MVKLIEREAQLARLAQTWETTRAGRGRVVGLVGSAGSGKTALAESAADRLRDEATVAWGRTWRGEDPEPYWPWRQLVRQVVKARGVEAAIAEMGPTAAPMGYLVPEIESALAREGIEQLAAPRPLHLYDAILTWLSDVAAERPMMLVLDGLENCDEGSLAVVEFFTREARDSRIMLLCLIDPDVIEVQRALETLGAIRRDGLTIEMEGLSLEGTRSLYEATAGEPGAPPIITAIHKASGGNPLFVREIARQFSGTGELHRPDRSMGFRVPRALKDVLLERVARLPERERSLLDMAAIVGADFDADVLAAIEGPDVLELLARLVSAGVLEEASGLGRYRFRHLMVREALYEGQSLATRRDAHARVAAILEDQRGESRVAEIADHLFKAGPAGDPVRAIRFARKAGTAALARDARDDAARHFERALKLSEIAGGDAEERSELADLLGRAERRSPSPPAEKEPAPPRNSFVREGDYWSVSFEGELARIRDAKGMRYLARLLTAPNAELHALDLVAGAGGGKRPLEIEGIDTGGGAAVLDDEAKRLIRGRIEDLRNEIEEAEEFVDVERAARAREELDALTAHLASALGLGGRDRNLPSPAERARVSVTRALRSAIARLSDSLPVLGQHLEMAVRTGTYVSYTPDPRMPPDWTVRT